MRLIVERDREIATLGERVAAGTIDAVIMITPAIAGGAGWAALEPLWRRRRRRVTPAWAQRWAHRPRWANATALRGAAGALTLADRNCRTPGKRILDIRRVDARTNGPVSARSAIIATFAQAMIAQAMRALNRPASERARQRSQAAAEKIRSLRESRPGATLDELSAETMAIYISEGANGLAMPARLGAEAVLLQLLTLRSPRRQTLAEHLSGTVVVRRQ